MYRALYRKWRPLVFADVIGQPHITKTLRTQVESGRLSHAYLFTGSRGTGKTTCAKILARAACCEAPKKGDPCNQCPSCLGIIEGSILDISEIDAASNSGVENIRSLQEEIVYTPVAVSKRVYIIDEVHMLSQGAFNALLKTLEEPPPHVLFILATTETHKVPATIVSRCQRFAFRRISAADIEERLRFVAAQEKLEISPEALSLLAHMADGALRDGLSLLDQCAGLASGAPMDEALCRQALGLSGRAEMAEWLAEIGRGMPSAALARLDAFYQSGQDFQSMLDQLSTLMRDLLMAQMLQSPSETRLPPKTAHELSDLWPGKRLLWGLSILTDTQNRLSRGLNKRIESELCILRLCGAVQPAGSAVPDEAPPMPKPIAPQAPKRVDTSLSTVPIDTHSERTDEPELPDKPEKPETPEQPRVAEQPETPEEPLQPADTEDTEPADTEPEENKQKPEEVSQKREDDSLSDDAEPEQDTQWPVLLNRVNVLYKNTLENVEHTLRNGRLYIRANPFSLGLLKQEEFRVTVEELYPGGLELSPLNAPPKPKQSKRLNQLQEQLGSAIQIE